MAIITLDSINNTSLDLITVNDVVNKGADTIVTARLGRQIKTLSGAIAAVEAQAFQVLDNPAALRLFDRPPTVGVVIMPNLGSGNDLLGGVYYWDETSVAADDGNLVIDSTIVGGNGRWRRILTNQGASPKNYGAYGDGTHNDLAAFNLLETYFRGFVIDLEGLTYGIPGTADDLSAFVPAANRYLNGFWAFYGAAVSGQTDHIFPVEIVSRPALACVSGARYAFPERGGNRKYMAPNVSAGSDALFGSTIEPLQKGFLINSDSSDCAVTLKIPSGAVLAARGKKMTVQWDMPSTVKMSVLKPFLEIHSSDVPSAPLTPLGAFAVSDTLVVSRQGLQYPVPFSTAVTPRDPKFPYYETFTVPDDASSLAVTFRADVVGGTPSQDIPIDNVYVSLGEGPCYPVPARADSGRTSSEVFAYSTATGAAVFNAGSEELDTVFFGPAYDYAALVSRTAVPVSASAFKVTGSSNNALHGLKLTKEKI